MSSIGFDSSVSTMQVQNAVSRAESKAAALIDQLSSGSQLSNSDGASLSINSQLSAQIDSMTQAQQNGNDATSMLQTADGGLSQIGGLLAQMNTLAVQSANGSLSVSDRADINTQFTDLSREVDRISSSTVYNGTSLLDGSLPMTTFQIGTFNSPSDQISVTLPDSTAASLGVSGLGVDTLSGAQLAIGSIEGAIQSVAMSRTSLGAAQTQVQSAVSNLATTRTNLTAANARIADTDYAAATTQLAQTQILQSAAIAMDAQANKLPADSLSLLYPVSI